MLGGTGALTMTPPVQLETDVAALPEGIAFDEQGGLWFAYKSGQFARFAASHGNAAANRSFWSSMSIARGSDGNGRSRRLGI